MVALTLVRASVPLLLIVTLNWTSSPASQMPSPAPMPDSEQLSLTRAWLEYEASGPHAESGKVIVSVHEPRDPVSPLASSETSSCQLPSELSVSTALSGVSGW